MEACHENTGHLEGIFGICQAQLDLLGTAWPVRVWGSTSVSQGIQAASRVSSPTCSILRLFPAEFQPAWSSGINDTGLYSIGNFSGKSMVNPKTSLNSNPLSWWEWGRSRCLHPSCIWSLCWGSRVTDWGFWPFFLLCLVSEWRAAQKYAGNWSQETDLCFGLAGS